MFCPFCGKELKTEPKFCPYCGHPIPEDDSIPLQNTQIVMTSMPYSGTQATDLNAADNPREVKTALKIPTGYYALGILLALMTIIWGLVAYVCYKYPIRLEVPFYGEDFVSFSSHVVVKANQGALTVLRALFEATRAMLVIITLLGSICVGSLFGLPLDINLFHRPTYAAKEKTEARLTRLARNGKVFTVIMAVFYVYEMVTLEAQFEPVGTITLIAIGLLTWLAARKVKKIKV